MKYKIIASDLDGTLLHDIISVSEENYRAIAEFNKMGGQLVPTSGRCFFEMPKALRDCKDIRYYISSNGAVVTDTLTGELDEALISNETFERIMALTFEYDTFHNVHFEGYSYILEENDSREVAEYYNLNEYYYMHYHEMCRKLESWDGVFDNGHGIEMVAIFFRSQEELDECVARLNELGGLHVTSSAAFNVEIVAAGASKGDGVRRLARKLDVPIDEVIGVGDSPNDMALLDGVGLPLAVSNADDVLKAKAARVICSHTEHIVRYILEKFVKE